MQTKQKTGQRGIISLIVILSVGFLAVSAALTIALSSFSGLLDNRNIKFGDFAFYTSEVAAKEGVLQFRDNLDYAGGSLAELNSSSGDILIDKETLGWPYVEVEGLANNRFSSRDNVLTLTLFAEGLAFNYAVFSETALDFKGNVVVDGNIFANDGIDFAGEAVNINGDAFSPEEIEDIDNINGDVFENVEPIPPPSIDIDEYIGLADIIFDNSSDAQTYISGQTVNAIVLVEAEDKTNIGGAGTNFTGCLVVRGDLDLTGGTFTATDDYPAIIVEGNLKIAGGATINGVVYVTGETSFGGGTNTINGSLLSVGSVTKTEITGNTVINFNPDYASIWQDIPGLDIISSVKPRIIDWRQE